MRVEKIAFPDMDRRYSYFGFNEQWCVVIHPSIEKEKGDYNFYSCWWKDGKCYALKTVSRSKAFITPTGKPIANCTDWYRVKYRVFKSMPFHRNMDMPVLIESDGVAAVRHETLAEFIEVMLEPPVKKKKERVNPDDGIVYFIKAENSPLIKIGTTVNLYNRLSELRVGNPHRLTVLATEQGGYSREQELHKKFRRLFVRGEWYRAEPELLNYIESIKEKVTE